MVLASQYAALKDFGIAMLLPQDRINFLKDIFDLSELLKISNQTDEVVVLPSSTEHGKVKFSAPSTSFNVLRECENNLVVASNRKYQK